MKMKYTTLKGVRGWKDLPPEICENVLAHLHFRDLCWARLVCKRWNHLITQRSFRSLRSNTPRQASFIFISPSSQIHRMSLEERHLFYPTLINGVLFEMGEKKDYFLKCSSGVQRSLDMKHTQPADMLYMYTLAADGGLIYRMFKALQGDWHHIVSNIGTKKFHRIRQPDVRFSYDDDIVVMEEDRATASFRIIIVEAHTPDILRREGVFLYSSSTNEWKWLCEVPGVNHTHRAISSIFAKGVFYTLFFDMSREPLCPELYSCDLEAGEWSYIDVYLPRPSHPREMSHLVMSLGRVFFVEYTGLPNSFPDLYGIPLVGYFMQPRIIKITIWEILVKEKKVIKVAKMPRLLKYPARMLEACSQGQYVPNPIAVLGCGNYIVILISFDSNPAVRWDLLRKCWEDLPALTAKFDGFDDWRGLFAGPVDF